MNKAQKGDLQRCLHGARVPLRLRRYDKPDNGPTHRIVLQADASVMGFNKRLANCQVPRPRPLDETEFRYPIEFVEDAVEVFRRDTDAPIDNQTSSWSSMMRPRTSTGWSGGENLKALLNRLMNTWVINPKSMGTRGRSSGMSKETCR